jgi:hypothetical protein
LAVVDSDGPAGGVDHAVVGAAEQYEVADAGGVIVDPVDDVMGLAVVRGRGAWPWCVAVMRGRGAWP